MSKQVSNKSINSVYMVGAFPPPVHGMSVVNAAIDDRLRSMGVIPTIFNTTIKSSFTNRTFFNKIKRFPIVLKALINFILAKCPQKSGFYISISGNYGQAYEIVFLLIARLRGLRLFLHHHSASYIIKKSILTWILIVISGKHAIHITQSPGLSHKLKTKYKLGIKSVSISNTAIVLEPVRNVIEKKKICTIGFLSNLSKEKGVFEFLDIVELLQEKKIQINAILAGPFQDKKTRCDVINKIEKLKNIRYIGPVYNRRKDLFFLAIDVFIFPTKYLNETEGIVNHEAMKNSVPVITYRRGAIPEIIDTSCGFVIDLNEPFVQFATEKLIEWFEFPEIYVNKSSGASKRFTLNYLESRKKLTWLLNKLSFI